MSQISRKTVGGLGGLLAALVALTAFGPARAEPSGPLFETSDRCLACHNSLVASDGRDISLAAQWRGSMMANAARDPYWQAAIRAETLDHPGLQRAIQDECAKCHMPMSRYTARAHGQLGRVFAGWPTAPGGGNPLAIDGVSCTSCHQIRDEGLGTPESFTGGFAIDEQSAPGQRAIWGPYVVDDGRRAIMRSATGFVPQQGMQLQRAALCATCHTLYTHAFDADGREVGVLPEQVPYLEWQQSSFATLKSCQDCHLPTVGERTAVSSVWGPKREQVSEHRFRGGNFLIPGMLNRLRADLSVEASSAELTFVARDARAHLREASAIVSMAASWLDPGSLEVLLSVEPKTGHKLPTAYPSRRAWVHLTVRNHRNDVVFESGRLEPSGAIVGNDNDADPEKFEPHYDEIQEPDQVQIYEAILGTPEGGVTTGLLRATQYLKDNRLLPRGWNRKDVPADVASHGAAVDDPTFKGGLDQLRYRIDLDPTLGPYRVQAQLWYQPIGYRWAQNLSRHTTDESDRFLRAFQAMSQHTAVRLASAEADVPALAPAPPPAPQGPDR